MLTPAQQAALKADVLASPDAVAVIGDLQALADLYNQPANPSYIVWRQSATRSELQAFTDTEWPLIDNLAVGKARIWEWLFENPARSIDPSNSGARAGILECWKGSGALVAVGAGVLQRCKRPASRYERVFATGTGTDAVPGLIVVAGPVIYQEFIPLNLQG